MRVEQVDERTYTVILNDAELDDMKAESEHSKLPLLDIMQAIFLMTFVQFMSCRYFRRVLRH